MKVKTQILTVFFAWLSMISVAQNNSGQAGLFLFTDSTFCTSGDTVWMNIKLPVQEGFGDIVHVQLDNLAGKTMINVLLAGNDNWAKGYVAVPDSLKTGFYFITAWMHNNTTSIPATATNSLLVYNRFDENLAQIYFPELNQPDEIIPNSSVEIKTSSEIFQTREKVTANLIIPSDIEIESAVIKAALIDLNSPEIQKYNFNFEPVNLPESGFVEKGGALISGKVTDGVGIPQTEAIVVLSTSGDIGYFDYYITGTDGLFHFFIKKAFGNTELIFQVFSDFNKDYKIDLLNASLAKTKQTVYKVKILTANEADFAKNAVQSSFISRLFTPPVSEKPDTLKMPATIPFYGHFTTQIYPGRFFDLPDFKEISRELLGGLQYRERNNEINIRMLNLRTDLFFDNEPMKLINGIPVFDNRIIARLKSTDIYSIELVTILR